MVWLRIAQRRVAAFSGSPPACGSASQRWLGKLSRIIARSDSRRTQATLIGAVACKAAHGYRSIHAAHRAS
jgi:hypothetical protein